MHDEARVIFNPSFLDLRWMAKENGIEGMLDRSRFLQPIFFNHLQLRVQNQTSWVSAFPGALLKNWVQQCAVQAH
jgi:hypothetical protein